MTSESSLDWTHRRPVGSVTFRVHLLSACATLYYCTHHWAWSRQKQTEYCSTNLTSWARHGARRWVDRLETIFFYRARRNCLWTWNRFLPVWCTPSVPQISVRFWLLHFLFDRSSYLIFLINIICFVTTYSIIRDIFIMIYLFYYL
jgi:hypothetical protein